MKIKAAIFDMDGTLVDSLMVWDVLWRKFGIKFLHDETFHPSEEDDKAVRTLSLKDAMELIHQKYAIGASGAELLDAANELIADFYRNDVQLKPGALEWLQHCKNNGVKMCIASATAPDLVSMAIEHCGIEEYFAKIFSCSEIGKGKDQPDIYIMAKEFFGYSSEETWVFEDSHIAIETAHGIGLKTVGIYDKYNFGQDQMRKIADEYIDDGESLMKLVKKDFT